MKKLLLSILFIAAAVMVQAQDAKPTKEETIEYIINYINSFNSDERSYIEEETKNLKVYFYTTYNSFTIKDCILNIDLSEYKEQIGGAYPYPKRLFRSVKIKIDLSKIESIDYSRWENRDGTISGIGALYFYSANHSKSIIRNDYSNDEILIQIKAESGNTSQIYKAFNHLRKLCGAPEPIKFD